MSTSNSIYSTCYVLTSCTPGNFTVLLTSTYLSQGLAPYVGGNVQIEGYPGVCFRVELSDSGCADCEKAPTLIPLGQGSGESFSLCNYNIVDFFSQNVTSYNITIDGLPYSFTFNPGDTEEDLLNNLNGLSLGIFTVGVVGTSPRLYVAGDFVYGNFCYTVCFNPPACSAIQIICAPANCQTQDKQCVYPPLFVQDASGTYSIVIDSVLYTSPLFPNLNDPEPLLQWLNSLTSAVFTVTYTPLPNRQITIYGYGSFTFGVLNLEITNGPSYLVIPVCQNINPICSCQPIRYFLLTPCDQSLPTYATQPVVNNLYPYEGTTVTFNQFGGACYNITSVFAGSPPPETQLITEYLDCPTPCSCNPPFYFNLVDCCTNEVYLYNNKPLYLEYTELCEPDTCPSDIGTKIITEFCNEDDGCTQGCFKLVEVDEPTPSDTIIIKEWENVIQEITTVLTCDDCIQQTCYLLTNCQDEEDTLVTNSDLSNYINHVISITGCKDKCWIVTESEDCESCIGKVEIIKDCPPIAGIPPGTLCSYDVGEVNIGQVLSYSITINGTVNSFIFNPGDTLETILDNINGLNLGQFSIGLVGTDPVYYMAGTETYGPLCYTRCLNPPDCLLVQNICIDPVCTPQSTECAYAPITVRDARGYYKIVIDGVTYTSPVFNNLNNPGPLLVWLTGLNKGIFTITYTPLPNRQISVFAYGNHMYGTLSVFLEKDDIPLSSVNAECTPLGTSTPDCACCLPPPPPQPGELVLHPRRIKPGYFSKNSCITTEYMERVNCNFAKQVYDAMLIKRYGITVCCDHDVDSWDIKKQVLDFELLTDPELCKSTLCRCPEPCLVSVSIALVPQCLAPVIVDTSIVLQCSCFTAVGTDYTINWTDCDGIINSADFMANTIVCAQTVPVVTEGTAIVEYVSACGNPLCVIPPIIECTCYIVKSFEQDPSEIGIIDCNGQSSIITIPGGEGVYFCSTVEPQLGRGFEVITLDPKDCPNQCKGECECLQVSTTVGEMEMTYLDCDNVIQSLYLENNQSANICGKLTSISITLGELPTITVIGACPCPEPPAECLCYSVFAPISELPYNYTYTDCITGNTVVTNTVGGTLFICSRTEPTSSQWNSSAVTLRSDLDCGLGECVSNPPCVPGCYRLLAIEPAVIFYLDCETGQTLELPVTAGTWFICSGNVPTFTGGVTEVVFISNDCGLDCTPL